MPIAPRATCVSPIDHTLCKSSNRSKCKFRVDSEKCVVTWNFERRGWTRTEGDDWNMYWASKATIRNIFNPELSALYGRLTDGQYVNHFPNHYELTRKDLLVKNINRYKKKALGFLSANTQKPVCKSSLEGIDRNAFTSSNANFCIDRWTTAESFDFLPMTFTLPSEYALFVKEFMQSPRTMWILKPSSKAQGKGIYIIHTLTQLKKWAAKAVSDTAQSCPTTKSINAVSVNMPREVYVISKYIESPLLLGGKKFDLRMYVLVVSYRPLQALVYQEGFARFCNVKYSTDVQSINNPFMHLTNVAVQKQNEKYNVKHGGKWKLRNLLLYLDAMRGRNSGSKLLASIYSLMCHSLKSVQNVIVNDNHSFECYGYDIIVDSKLKPWLCEVNASPSLSTTTEDDQRMKCRLIRDVLDIVIIVASLEKRASFEVPKSSGFQWLMDESTLLESERQSRDLFRKQTQRPQSGHWR